jgi:hypothetical protein
LEKNAQAYYNAVVHMYVVVNCEVVGLAPGLTIVIQSNLSAAHFSDFRPKMAKRNISQNHSTKRSEKG